MSGLSRDPTPFWRTVGVLLLSALRRSRGRAEYQQRLRQAQRGDDFDWGAMGGILLVLIAAAVNGGVAALLYQSLDHSQRVSIEASGRMLVSGECLEALERIERRPQHEPRGKAPSREDELRKAFAGEGVGLDTLEERQEYERRLLAHYLRFGRAGLVEHEPRWGLARTAGRLDPLANLVGSLVVMGWFVMLTLQGEGVDLDLQRRRHPMWEWLLSHPVDSRAVFLADMITPLAANPTFLMAPVFWVGAYWMAYDDFGVGLAAGLAVGLPLTIAAGCFSKALEIVALLRLPPRSRGAALGILAWVGQGVAVAMVFLVFTPSVGLAGIRHLARGVGPRGFPVFGWALGLRDESSAWSGVLAGWVAAAALIGVAIQISAHATRRGLAGGFAGGGEAPVGSAGRSLSWLVRDSLYRKELLWLGRDRGALIQVFLLPLTFAAFQVFQMRRVVMSATQAWHLLTGASVLFGSYFLWALGPRSLVSEGAALWIPLTWPRGLEDLLRAKARLWWVLSCVVVGPLLVGTAFRFPADATKVALIGIVWVAFAGSLAEKTVTLVSVPSSSGEPEPVPKGRRWAATLGTFTFAVGVLSQQWTVAVTGVVYSWLTSAALWQNFRARLPYLFDPWSERLPSPPTLMHAMVAISAMTEGMAFVFALSLLVLGKEAELLARAVAYGIAGLVTWLVVEDWLNKRRVPSCTIWGWTDDVAEDTRAVRGIPIALGLGLILAFGAIGYTVLLKQIPWGEGLRAASAHLATHPNSRVWMAVMAVGFAPVAEEYLFRGLLFRALDREWGGARAVWGSACFFAIYHAPQAWLPVALLGAASAWLFRRHRHLGPCVVLHATYNAVVVWAA